MARNNMFELNGCDECWEFPLNMYIVVYCTLYSDVCFKVNKINWIIEIQNDVHHLKRTISHWVPAIWLLCSRIITHFLCFSHGPSSGVQWWFLLNIEYLYPSVDMEQDRSALYNVIYHAYLTRHN